MNRRPTAADPLADSLWRRLRAVDADHHRDTARAEDALFRHYLPLATSLAATRQPGSIDRAELEQAAEVGLAQAILAWRHPDGDGFEGFARYAVTCQLRRRRTASRPVGTARPVRLPPPRVAR